MPLANLHIVILLFYNNNMQIRIDLNRPRFIHTAFRNAIHYLYNRNATSNWKFEANLKAKSQSFHACEEGSISQDLASRKIYRQFI
jgi:hypothetical protein